MWRCRHVGPDEPYLAPAYLCDANRYEVHPRTVTSVEAAVAQKSEKDAKTDRNSPLVFGRSVPRCIHHGSIGCTTLDRVALTNGGGLALASLSRLNSAVRRL